MATLSLEADSAWGFFNERICGVMDSEADILEFAGASFRSVWALELLLMLRRSRDRSWDAVEILRELRSSQVAVIEALDNLTVAGLVAAEGGDRYRYSATGRLADAVGARTIGWLSVEDLNRIAGAGLCDACFSNRRPLEPERPEDQLPLFQGG